ncbi:rhodanese-like domain-containing protein [Frigoriflavimonas asaccharolytica]|uniref:Rhodanese-related sulfurtransferase n=1 Tax=Frigoriflavimonas asaccharolytica TaxID=2735899 RepID=A0A8J8KAR1_9FLAO|nr:rhodanese-like domain-containing protein [Frigoriflavimonas asaccharolytica]NRS91729.1 rhodanese-related sulfurtransferase [Frigoriflavimonas asaccharolytica]
MNLVDILKEKKYHLIDVREEMELEIDGSIPEAAHIPLGEIEDRKQEIVNLAGPKIFFCRSGNRSGKAMEYFKAEGLTEVYNGGAYADLQATLDEINS